MTIRMNHIARSLVIVLCCLGIPGVIQAQTDIQQEVRVVKPYTPTLSDAEKIDLLPEFNDTISVTTDFNYSIQPRPFTTQFDVNPIKPARMVGLPLERLYKSQLTLGIGNYVTPLAELTINQLRDRQTSMGIYLKHHSSSGRVRLENDKRVNSNFSDNLAKLYWKRMFRNSTLDLAIRGGYHSWLHYGYDPSITDTVLRKEDVKQDYITAGAGLSFYSSHADSTHLNYQLDAEYDYLQDKFDFAEHGLRTRLTMGKLVKDWYVGADLGVEIYERTGDFDSLDNAVVSFNPSISRSSEDWRFVLGVRSAFDSRNGETGFSLYPELLFQFNIVKDVLVPYMGVTGYKQVNTYRSLLMENPFVAPGTLAANGDYTLVGFFGLRGRYSSKMSFDLRGTYSQVDSMYFFINEMTRLGNRFMLDYQSLNETNIGAEITWNYSPSLKFVLEADYFSYSKEIWHKPDFVAGLNTAYNLRDKILVDLNFFYTGKRLALLEDEDEDFYNQELKGYFDANMSVEYRYTSLLSFFLRFSNLTASRYQIWNYYPAQRFQIMAGFSYAL